MLLLKVKSAIFRVSISEAKVPCGIYEMKIRQYPRQIFLSIIVYKITSAFITKGPSH